MRNLIKKITVAFLALLVVAGALAPLADVFAATFNNDSRDYATLQVSNYTRNPGSTSNWTNTVSANAGEVVSFLVYYHNTASDVANNTRIRVQLPSGAFTSQTITGEVFADNASVVAGSGSVNLSSSQSLTFIPGSVAWYPNQTSVAQSLPNGQNGSEIVSTNGVTIGNVASGWDAQGYIVFRAQVSSTPVGSLPSVTTSGASAITQNSATASASVNPNSSATTAWFEYGTTQALGNTTASQSIGAGTVSATVSANLQNLSANTTYYYRAVAQNTHGVTQGSILNFSTQLAGSLPSATTDAATTVTANAAVLSASVNPNNANTTVWFEYGTSALFGNAAGNQAIGSGNIAVNPTHQLSGLAPRTLYYYRVVAQNSYGTSFGSTMNLTTKSDGPVSPVPNGPSVLPGSF